MEELKSVKDNPKLRALRRSTREMTDALVAASREDQNLVPMAKKVRNFLTSMMETLDDGISRLDNIVRKPASPEEPATNIKANKQKPRPSRTKKMARRALLASEDIEMADVA